MAVADITRFQKLLPEIKSALIVLPQNPAMDMDHVASGLALSLALQKNAASTTVSAPVPMLVEFNRLVGVDKVRENLGENNLVITFENYPADDIERVTCGIEGEKFTLVAVPKPGNKAPHKEQVALSYSGVSADFVIVVGANYPEGLGKFAQKKDVFATENLAVLANVPLSGWAGAIELIDASASSISEVTYDVIEESGLALDEDIATNLFLGMEAGTRNFTSQGVSAQTFAKASRLLAAGARRAPLPRFQAAFQPPRPQRGDQKGGQQTPRSDWQEQQRVFKGPTLP